VKSSLVTSFERSPAFRTLAVASTYVVPDLYWLLRAYTRDCDTVLDVGCGGATSPFGVIGKRPGQRRTGADHFAPALDRSRQAGVHDDYVLADVFDEQALPDRFDCVVALDLIEHFEKPRSAQLLERLESLARRRVIVLTPNGFLPQEPFDGNESQRHLCGWSANELRARGYTVFGASGAKFIKGPYALPRWKPPLLWSVASLVTQYAAVAVPELAFHLFAVKRLDA
jgi:SAM-dependent methyltransferase